MPTNIPSVSRFARSDASGPDPKQNPAQATHFWLRRDIARGVFAPMERLKVEFLSSFYDVGFSPAREAILLLSSSGLIIHEHQKGYRVAPVSLADYDDLKDVYDHIYRLALGLALEKGDETWEERVIVQLHRSLKVQKVLVDGDPEAREMWQFAYGKLHRTMLSGCGSPLLLELYMNIGHRLERYVNLFADQEMDRRRDHHTEHKEIVDALLSRDKELTFARIDAFFLRSRPFRESISNSLANKDASEPDSEGRAISDEDGTDIAPAANIIQHERKKRKASKSKRTQRKEK